MFSVCFVLRVQTFYRVGVVREGENGGGDGPGCLFLYFLLCWTPRGIGIMDVSRANNRRGPKRKKTYAVAVSH
jgi:hypothetical protein